MTPQQLARKANEMDVPLAVAVQCRKRYLRSEWSRLSGHGGWYPKHRQSEIVAEAKKLDRLLTSEQKYALSEDDIDSARRVPFGELVVFDRMGKARKSCPGDGSHSVDLLSKTNRVKCYPCDETWDTIGWVMATVGKDFIDAVRYLIGR